MNKVHDVNAGGVIGGIKTDVDLKKGTLYRAGKGPGITFEALLDREDGEKKRENQYCFSRKSHHH